MDAYLTCPDTKKLVWLGKPIRQRAGSQEVSYYNQNKHHENFDDTLLNKVLWKFLAEHAHKELRVLFSGEFDDDEYEHISTWDVEAEEYVKNWPPK